MQVPSAVSAIKVKGERAYARVRGGETVELAARPVRVDEFVVRRIAADGPFVDVDVHVECSSGTYIRALARDLGERLGVGGHLTLLRRTRVGRFGIEEASALDELGELDAEHLPVVGLDDVAATSFLSYLVDSDQVVAVRNGRAMPVRLPEPPAGQPAPVAMMAADGTFLALYEQHGPVAKAVAVFTPA
jgi:tRNA pseudouridine55 synthase